MPTGFYPGSLLSRFVGMRTGWSWAAAVYSLKTHSFLPQRLGEGLGQHEETLKLILTRVHPSPYFTAGVSSSPGLAKLVGECNPWLGCSVVRSTLGDALSRGFLEGLTKLALYQTPLPGLITTGGRRTSPTRTGAPRLGVGSTGRLSSEGVQGILGLLGPLL